MPKYRYTATDPDGFVWVRYLHAKDFEQACAAAERRKPWYELLLGVDHVAETVETAKEES